MSTITIYYNYKELLLVALTAIITDGVNDLSKDLIKEYDILTIPYRIIHGDDVFRIWHNEKCNISLEDLCSRISNSSKEELPSTSIPTPGEIHFAFEKALTKSTSILALFQASEMAGTFKLAQSIANNGFSSKDITIFDTKRIMHGSGIQALEAAKQAKKGKSKQEILKHLETLNPKVRTIVIMNDLKFLYYGGRIGRAKKLLASTFNIIPSIHFVDGLPSPLTTFKGTKNLSSQLHDFCKTIMNECITNDIFITHINYDKITDEIYDSMTDINNNGINIHYNKAGPIMGVYSGTKAICISYIGNWDPKWLSK
ncbi:MAG: DegV family protein [Asgard group archaeon]|nr:DegV family protein [Asgard group archaeon]